MAMELRQYQMDNLNDLRDAFIRARDDDRQVRIMTQLPTGSGKTACMMTLADRWIEKGIEAGRPKTKVIWLTHRTELQEQAFKQAKLWDVRVFSPWISFQHLTVLSPGKINNRIKKAAEYGGCPWMGLGVDEHSLMIVDEAHHASASTWKRSIQEFPGAVIGFTATPYRLSKKEGFTDIFDTLVTGPNLSWFIENGYLANIRAWHVPSDTGEIVGIGGGNFGEFNISKTEKGITARSNEYAIRWCLDMCAEHNIPQRIIAFCLSIKHAEMVCAQFQSLGVAAGVIHSKMGELERMATVRQFGDGDLDVLANVNIATEGFDCPDARVILMLRPTKSKSLFLQMAGRGTRVSEGKDFCMILDATDNCQRFGLPQECDMTTDWSLEPRGDKVQGEAPMKYCDKCHAINHAAATVCVECGYILRAACDFCNRYRKVSEMQPAEVDGKELAQVCVDCRGSYAEDFENAEEVLSMRLNWRVSTKNNLTVKYETRRNSYQLTIYQKRGSEKWSYVIFQGGEVDPVGWSGNCKSEVSAKEKGTDKLRELVNRDAEADNGEYGSSQKDMVMPPADYDRYDFNLPYMSKGA